MPILRAHTITSSLGSAHPSNYRKCETVNSFEVLTIVTKNSILHNLAWFLDLLLVTEKIYLCWRHYAKSVRSRSYTGPHFPAFGLTTERYSVSLRVRLECGENVDKNNSEYGHFWRSQNCVAQLSKKWQNIKCHIGKEFVCAGFQCKMVQYHCVKAAKEEGRGKTLAAKMPLRLTKPICRRLLTHLPT